MEVSESEWVSKAIDNVDRYLHRGGKCQGDVPQLLGGTDLLNTIGMAMGLPIRDPNKWSDSELKKALNNELVYYEGKALEAIEIIADRIRRCCDGDNKNFVTVLPIELYYNGKLYELPVFRVQRYKDSKKYYVDNIGRSYRSVDDWFSNSKLPPCKMAYPRGLELKLRPGYDYSHVLVTETPLARGGSKALRVVDRATAVAGIGSGIGLLFASGGLAAPLVLTGVATAVWGTGRTTTQLADRALHGETINPFTNSESRMMWLGVAANLVSFGAMGASMRLASLAARGQNISNAFRLFVNVANGTTVAVSGVAILDTTIFLFNNKEDLSGADVLMHVASIAFWTKGLFTYKTAGTIIRETENLAFLHINKELSGEQAAELTALRKSFRNDARLLREFHRAAHEKNVPMKTFSKILLDANRHGEVQFDGKGNLILPGGQKYSFDFLGKLPGHVRRHYFEIITNLNPEQMELLESFRQTLNDDMMLITGLNRVAVRFNVNAREATEGVLHFWRTYSKMNLPGAVDVNINDGQLVLGSAPPISIAQLPQLSSPMVRFIGEHLSRMDVATSHQWQSSIPVLVNLERSGLFSVCRVTKIINSGRAVVSLNDHLQISIYRLNSICSAECRQMFDMLSKLAERTSGAALPADLRKLCVEKHRLRLEVQRADSLLWAKRCAEQSEPLSALLRSPLLAHEKDRLYTFRSTVDTFKAQPYITEMMKFVAKMNPKNVGEMVAYCEFVVKYVETEKLMVKQALLDGILILPRNVNKAEWMRKQASERVFKNTRGMEDKFSELIEVVRSNNMVGVEQVAAGLGDAELVAALRGRTVRFGSEVSAAYHIYKHPTQPLHAYVARANETIRECGSRWIATLTQEGDARSLQLESAGGRCVLLECGGRVLLCTFSPTKT